MPNVDYGPARESDTVVMDWLEGGARSFGHFIAGSWTEPQGPPRTTACPADGRPLATVHDATSGEVDRAVAAATGALEGWRGTPGHQRARHLYGMARAIQRHARHLAVLESLDNGKPIRESRDLDIPLVARHFYHHAGWAQILDREFPDACSIGVAGQIIPWNFPLLMLAWKVAPALAAGATVVLKPAEYTPLTALFFAELVAQAGLPPGVFNLVTGAADAGAALVRHPDVAKIAFTGSTEVGRSIRRATAGSGKRLTLELGGKSPAVVFETADLDAAVEGVVDGIWYNQGQVCCAGSRLLVQESVEELFLDRLRRRMESLRMGHPLDKTVDLGAIVDESQLARIRGFVSSGEAQGARVWQPSWWGREAKGQEAGLFFPPTLCTHADPASPIVTEEVFGPVVVASSFRTPAEAVELANDTRYGLAASVWSDDLNVALDAARQIEAGTVWVNCTNLFDAAAGFGGFRESGFGREGGREGMWEYLAPRPATRRHSQHPAEGAGPGRSLATPDSPAVADGRGGTSDKPAMDRTWKLYIGGKQVRADGGYSLSVVGAEGAALADVPRGGRKDVRNAVEAARKAREAWGRASGHHRAQILYFLGENLTARGKDFAELLRATGVDAASAGSEVDAAVQHLFTFAAWADKVDGQVHRTPFRHVTLAMYEPAGAVGVRCSDHSPLAAPVGALAAVMSMGGAVVVVPSEGSPVPALELVQILETSDVPGGVANIVSGLHGEVIPTLSAHDGVEDYWDFVGDEITTEAERASAGNLKRVWNPGPTGPDWSGLTKFHEAEILRRATRVKNIWVPYGA
ncbi:MAG: aldehyde dehydrogenase family protein [Gemmatimonadota bacterium]|nr:aldehyde dehydrogenase family protein [Gemmatimonadota bacterium]